MPLATKEAQNDEIIRAVQELIAINIDSFNGCTHAAAHIGNTRLQTLFIKLADQRAAQAVDLQKRILRNGEEPITAERIAGRVDRRIMDWRAALAGGAMAVLKEAERSETYIRAKYEAALAKTAEGPTTNVLRRQYRAVKKAQSRIRDVRENWWLR